MDVIQRTAGFRLYGICDPEVACREEAVRLYGVRPYATIEQVLSDDDVHAVVVATPTQTHAPLALRCLEAGKHVVVEKPMCLTTREADELIEASRRKRRLLTVRHNRRWDADYLAVKDVIAQGLLGTVLVLDAAFNALIRPSGWRARADMGGGELVDWGCHLVDQVLQLMPAAPRSVFAHIDSRGWDVEVETYARLWLKFADGAIAEIEASNISWLPRPRWHVLGETGSLVYSQGRFRLRTNLEDREFAPPASQDMAFYAGVAEALKDGKEPPVKPEEVRRTIAVLEAAFVSATSGQPVPLDDR